MIRFKVGPDVHDDDFNSCMGYVNEVEKLGGKVRPSYAEGETLFFSVSFKDDEREEMGREILTEMVNCIEGVELAE